MPARVWILWLLFLVRGVFYCQLLPLWEGWDEYAHMAWIQHWIATGRLAQPSDGIPPEIDQSLRQSPLPNELRWMGAPYLTHEQWWKRAPPTTRLTAPRLDSYEAQQPPLYYWIMSVPARMARHWSLPERVKLLRWLSLLLVSLVIPFTWLATRDALAAGLLAIAPGLAIDAARVANDALLIPAAAALLWLLTAKRPNGTAAGTTLGIALLAKASALAFIPALVILWFRRARRELFVASSIAAALAGWWYVRNLISGHALTGWAQDRGALAAFRGITRINWLHALDTEAKSFLWFGGWSFLTLKAWMYRVPEALTALSLPLLLFRRPQRLAPALTVAVCAAFAVFWGILAYYASQGVPNLPGWYLWPFAPALAALIAAGLGRFSLLLIIALAAMDIFGASAVMAPYYAGLVAHSRADITYFPAALARLHISWWPAAAWLAATFSIPALLYRKSER